MKTISKLLKNIILIVVVVLVTVLAVNFYYSKDKNNLNTQEKVTEISLKDIGELATQEAYVTVVEAMDKDRKLFSIDIPFTKSICIFSHDFVIKAGYNFETIKTTVTEPTEDKLGKITVELPAPQILSCGIKTDSEVVYYESESIFTNLSETEKAEVRKQMEKTAKDTAVRNGLFDNAKDNAKKVLSAFIYNLYDSSKYQIEFIDVE